MPPQTQYGGHPDELIRRESEAYGVEGVVLPDVAEELARNARHYSYSAPLPEPQGQQEAEDGSSGAGDGNDIAHPEKTLRDAAAASRRSAPPAGGEKKAADMPTSASSSSSAAGDEGPPLTSRITVEPVDGPIPFLFSRHMDGTLWGGGFEGGDSTTPSPSPCQKLLRNLQTARLAMTLEVRAVTLEVANSTHADAKHLPIKRCWEFGEDVATSPSPSASKAAQLPPLAYPPTQWDGDWLQGQSQATPDPAHHRHRKASLGDTVVLHLRTLDRVVQVSSPPAQTATAGVNAPQAAHQYRRQRLVREEVRMFRLGDLCHTSGTGGATDDASQHTHHAFNTLPFVHRALLGALVGESRTATLHIGVGSSEGVRHTAAGGGEARCRDALQAKLGYGFGLYGNPRLHVPPFSLPDGEGSTGGESEALEATFTLLDIVQDESLRDQAGHPQPQQHGQQLGARMAAHLRQRNQHRGSSGGDLPLGECVRWRRVGSSSAADEAHHPPGDGASGRIAGGHGGASVQWAHQSGDRHALLAAVAVPLASTAFITDSWILAPPETAMPEEEASPSSIPPRRVLLVAVVDKSVPTDRVTQPMQEAALAHALSAFHLHHQQQQAMPTPPTAVASTTNNGGGGADKRHFVDISAQLRDRRRHHTTKHDANEETDEGDETAYSSLSHAVTSSSASSSSLRPSFGALSPVYCPVKAKSTTPLSSHHAKKNGNSGARFPIAELHAVLLDANLEHVYERDPQRRGTNPLIDTIRASFVAPTKAAAGSTGNTPTTATINVSAWQKHYQDVLLDLHKTATTAVAFVTASVPASKESKNVPRSTRKGAQPHPDTLHGPPRFLMFIQDSAPAATTTTTTTDVVALGTVGRPLEEEELAALVALVAEPRPVPWTALQNLFAAQRLLTLRTVFNLTSAGGSKNELGSHKEGSDYRHHQQHRAHLRRRPSPDAQEAPSQKEKSASSMTERLAVMLSADVLSQCDAALALWNTNAIATADVLARLRSASPFAAHGVLGRQRPSSHPSPPVHASAVLGALRGPSSSNDAEEDTVENDNDSGMSVAGCPSLYEDFVRAVVDHDKATAVDGLRRTHAALVTVVSAMAANDAAADGDEEGAVNIIEDVDAPDGFVELNPRQKMLVARRILSACGASH